MPLFSFEGRSPQVHPDAWIAPTATLVGDVVVEAGASIWYGAVLRADFGRIVVRAGANVQDGSVLHGGDDPETEVGPGATIGHVCVVHGAVIGAEALIGNGSTVQDGARIGARTLIGAGSLVPPNAVIPDEVMALGAPARVRGPLSAGAAVWVDGNPSIYQELARRHAAGALPVDPSPAGDRPRGVRHAAGMSLLPSVAEALTSGRVEIVDLTAPLSAETPVIQLPPEFAQTARFELEELSRYDDRGPAWYWNNFRTGEHTGTHFDAPNHWVTGQDGEDVASVPPSRLIGPAVVLDFSAQVAENPDFLLEVEHIEQWQAEHGPLPEGGWLLYRTGWDARSASQQDFLNADETGPHTPGVSPACATWLGQEAPIIGVGVETVGTDAGAAHSFDPPFPCHAALMGSGKYGLTQLQNLAQLPPTGVLLIAAPLPIVTGSGAPARVLALVER